MSEPTTSPRVPSLLASARRLTSADMRERAKQRRASSTRKGASDWQSDAWDMYDLVGEQRYLASTLAARMAQSRLFVSTVGSTQDEPEPSDDPRLAAILAHLGSPQQLAAMVERVAVNLFVAGEAWLMAVPRAYLPGEYGDDGERRITADTPPRVIDEIDESAVGAMDWRVFSTSEVNYDREGTTATLKVESAFGLVTVDVPVDELFIMRIWRPHPRRAWEPDSPTRSSLPVLRELVGLTMHISAQIDSRLAGAGILVVPQSVSNALKATHGLSPDSDEDPFTDGLMEAMITPISDRDSASALVPLVVTAPDQSPPFQHVSFASPLDAEAREMRDEAIRRLALGQDAPPELLLGTDSMNHWGAWLVREDVVETHLRPPLAIICDALTRQYLRPMMRALGYPEHAVLAHEITASVEHLITRPNRGTDAQALHAAGALSDEALRRANGFDDGDAPTVEITTDAVAPDAAVTTALDMLSRAPSLAQSPGLPALVAQIRQVLGIPQSPEDAALVAPPPAPAAPAAPADDTATAEAPADGQTPEQQTEATPPGFTLAQLAETVGGLRSASRAALAATRTTATADDGTEPEQ